MPVYLHSGNVFLCGLAWDLLSRNFSRRGRSSEIMPWQLTSSWGNPWVSYKEVKQDKGIPYFHWGLDTSLQVELQELGVSHAEGSFYVKWAKPSNQSGPHGFLSWFYTSARALQICDLGYVWAKGQSGPESKRDTKKIKKVCALIWDPWLILPLECGSGQAIDLDLAIMW